MNIYARNKLKEKEEYLRYLRENSHYYKILNRDPDMFNEFVNEVKKNYKLRTSDKINDAINTFEMLTSIFGALK